MVEPDESVHLNEKRLHKGGIFHLYGGLKSWIDDYGLGALITPVGLRRCAPRPKRFYGRVLSNGG